MYQGEGLISQRRYGCLMSNLNTKQQNHRPRYFNTKQQNHMPRHSHEYLALQGREERYLPCIWENY